MKPDLLAALTSNLLIFTKITICGINRLNK